jgi:hypothetical protein
MVPVKKFIAILLASGFASAAALAAGFTAVDADQNAEEFANVQG